MLSHRLTQAIVDRVEPTIKDITAIYSVLSDEDKSYLESNHKVIKYKRHQIIYREGETPDGLQCLGSGKVKIFTAGVGGRDQIVRLARAPGFIGYRALFAKEAHVASAVVIEPCTIFHINKDVIEYLMARNNKLCMNIIHAFATELGFSRYRTVSLTQKHIRGRLAESIIHLRDVYGYRDDGKVLDILLSREDLASFSNMTTSNAIRTLTSFVKEGVLSVNGRLITILDEKLLERISSMG